jgi:DeoR/GlpR family transcriptional regulator of sugar metabolism
MSRIVIQIPGVQSAWLVGNAGDDLNYLPLQKQIANPNKILDTACYCAYHLYYRSYVYYRAGYRGVSMSEIFNTEFPEARRQVILEQLQQNGSVTTGDLKKQFGISEDTIRRDLRELAKAGQLTRVHGGALPVAPVMNRFTHPSAQNSDAQIIIAKAAAQLVENNQVILFDGGTTTLEISKHLNPAIKATAITISPQIAIALSSYYNLEVILLGGRLSPASLTTQGAAVVQQIHEIRADICLLGVCSLHPQIGLTTLDYEEAHIKRALVRSSGDIVAVVTADKFGTVVPYDVCSLQQLTYLVTEKSIPQEQINPYLQAGIEIIQA